MKVFDKVLFLGKECTIRDIDEKRKMYKITGSGTMTWLKESDLKPLNKGVN